VWNNLTLAIYFLAKNNVVVPPNNPHNLPKYANLILNTILHGIGGDNPY
jgi:hypothetical protein